MICETRAKMFDHSCPRKTPSPQRPNLLPFSLYAVILWPARPPSRPLDQQAFDSEVLQQQMPDRTPAALT